MSDYNYLSASNGSGDAPLMHITANRLVGATTIAVDSVTNVPTDFIATSGTLLSTGFIDPTTKTDFKGHVSAGNLIIDAFEPGSTDNGNTSGQVVVIKPSTGWANRVAQHIQNVTGFGTPEALYATTLSSTGLATLNTLQVGDNPYTEGAFQTYTPTLYNITQGSGTLTARYAQFGKFVRVRFKFLFGAGSAIASQPQFAFPVTPRASSWASEEVIGFGSLLNQTVDIFPAVLVYNSTNNSVEFRAMGTQSGTNPVYIHASTATLVDATHPFTFTSSPASILSGSFEYEAA